MTEDSALVEVGSGQSVPVRAEALADALRPFLRADFAMFPLEVAVAVLAQLAVSEPRTGRTVRSGR